MLWPLRILAFFACILGLFGTPLQELFRIPLPNYYHHFVHFAAAHSPEPRLWLMGLSLGMAILGIAAGWALYHPARGMEGFRQKVIRPLPVYWLYCLWRGKYWLDEIWWAILVVPMFTVMRALAWFDRQIVDGIVNLVGGFTVLLSRAWRLFDIYIVDGIVNAVGYVTKAFGEIGKFVQTGRVQSYALIVFICVFAMVVVRILQLQ
jgi:NADH-quinone oxidoreductase subunit L